MEDTGQPVREAIEIMTAFRSLPDGDNYVKELIQRRVDEEGMGSLASLTAGLTILSGLLLKRLEQSQPGTPSDQTLKEIALDNLRP